MRVLVLGAGGMLGHKLCQVLDDRFETWTTVRSDPSRYDRFELLDPKRLIGGVAADDPKSLTEAFETVKPTVVINAIGIIKQLPEAHDPITSITINSLTPHRIADLCEGAGARMIHVSTDCVFTGNKGMYVESDPSDATDLYGRSKLLGEIDSPKGLTLRTSIIGRELNSSNGLVEWFLSNRGGTVEGWKGSIFSGLPTIVLAELIADLIEEQTTLSGLWHVSADPISKLDLLNLINEAYDAGVTVRPVEGEAIDRSLDSSRFRSETRFEPPSWPDLIKKMATDPTPYDSWRERG